MLFKHAVAAMLLLLAACGVRSSNEWNDTVVGYVADVGREVVMAYKTPCTSKVMDKIPVKQREGWGNATYLNPAGSLKGCWKALGSEAVFLWEDGSYGTVHQYKFRLLRAT
jgi:hypothetical protein